MSTLVVCAKFAPKGWKDDSRYVYVGRMRSGRISPDPAKVGGLGNPYKVSDAMPLEDALDRFRAYAEDRVKLDPDYRAVLRSLRHKTLVCHCAPKGGLRHTDPHVCHGQILAEIAERLASEVAL